MEYTPQPYEGLTIMDLYCSVQDAFDEVDTKEEKRKARRRQKARKRSNAEREARSAAVLSPKTSGCRKKSSTHSGKAVFRPMTLRPRGNRRHSIAVTSFYKDGGVSGTGERRLSKSKRKSSGSDARRKLSMVSQLKEMKVDCVAMRTRKASQTKLSIERLKGTRRHTCDYLPSMAGVLL